MDTLSVLESAGVVSRPNNGWNIEDFVNTQVATLVRSS